MSNDSFKVLQSKINDLLKRYKDISEKSKYWETNCEKIKAEYDKDRLEFRSKLSEQEEKISLLKEVNTDLLNRLQENDDEIKKVIAELDVVYKEIEDLES